MCVCTLICIYTYMHVMHMHTHLFLMSVYMCVKKYFFILKNPNPSQLPLFIDGKGKALRKQLSWSDALADKEEFD